jgi:hypothetical protein
MNIIKEYMVIHDFGKDGLVQQVNQLIKEGWQPLGGIMLHKLEMPEIDRADLVWVQALVMYEEPQF